MVKFPSLKQSKASDKEYYTTSVAAKSEKSSDAYVWCTKLKHSETEAGNSLSTLSVSRSTFFLKYAKSSFY